jgi:soluble lytic murein transglycosylase-like protein
MPRTTASYSPDDRQTAQSGCLSGFLLPPLIALCLGLLFASAVGGFTDFSTSPQALAAADGTLAPLFTPEVQFWTNNILRWSADAGIDPNLAATVMQIESCGHPDVVSSAGASGLFQVMPFHFLGLEDRFDPDTNARRGLDYLRRSLEAAGNDPRLAFAGYNGGIGVIGRGESGWAAETIRYVYWGMGIYEDAINGASESTRLNEWLAAGGASLCARAKERLGIH